MNIKGVRLLVINVFFLVTGNLIGQNYNCPVEEGTLRKVNKEVIRGEGNINSIIIDYKNKEQLVKSIIKGEIELINDSIGNIVIANKKIKIRYWCIKPLKEIYIGKKVKPNEVIGSTDEVIGFLRLDFISEDKKYIFKFMEGICN